MRIELTEVLWFEEHSITLAELSELCALPLPLLQELVGGGAIEPLETAGSEPRFGAQALNAARAARRLRDDFDLDASGLLLALGLLERVQELEREIRTLRARLPGPLNPR
ncbi:MAG TPA: chaperone modulator CbpM [Steroidobacteraceae bacterium]|jgi:chaperone modulatory protein CbpM|nr:chaperone modulator CbpM [Steroidobacteraceae bacterium]